MTAPSPGYRPPEWWPATQADVRLIWQQLLALEAAAVKTNTRLDTILKEIKKMGAQSQAALAELSKDLRRLADGYVAQQAKIVTLEAALAEADAVKAQAVADAIEADDAIDTAAIADADAIVEAVSPEPATEPESEPAPEG